jgi:hypothetical protein
MGESKRHAGRVSTVTIRKDSIRPDSVGSGHAQKCRGSTSYIDKNVAYSFIAVVVTMPLISEDRTVVVLLCDDNIGLRPSHVNNALQS